MEQPNPFLGTAGLDWAREQLKEAGYEQSHVAHLVRKMHEALNPYAIADPEGTASAMPIVARLMVGLPLGEAQWSERKRATATFVWREVLPNSLSPGDIVRVKPDAYTDQRAAVNGKVGTVTALRGGVVVRYEGQRALTMGDRHAPDKLERQVPIRRKTQ